MTAPLFVKAGILTILLVASSVISWELYVRSKGFETSFDDDPALWSDKRRMVYEPASQSTVFIGSSRIKFDLDIPTWENTTGDHAIQLASVGSNPLPVLHHLADDPDFKGKLVIDVTEGLFFSMSPRNSATPEKNIDYYKEQTYAQKASFVLNHAVESRLAFLDKDRLSLNAYLSALRVPNRPGVFEMPIFPGDFGRTTFDRQDYMTDKFLADSNLQNEVKGIWDFFRRMNKDAPVNGAPLDSILASVKKSTDKIKARGGQVLFVRTPSSGPFLMGENMGFPREKYWKRLLEYTGCPGIHFADYPAIANFVCPELSHLSKPDVLVFTQNLIQILGKEQGWKFPRPVQTTP